MLFRSISFTTSTPLAATDTIVLTFPAAGHVTTLANNQCGISSPAGKSTTSAMAADPHTITLTLAASNTLAAGAVTVTCGGMTLAAKPMAAAASGVTIRTSKDAVAASVAIPAVGAVTATAASALTLSPVAATAGQTATISFTTSTPLAASDTIVLTFPGTGHVTTLANNQCGISSPVGKSTTSAMAAGPPHTITITLAADNTLAAGAVTVTCGGMTLAAKPMAAAASGLQIKTSKDAVAASVAILAVGAVTVTSASALTLSPVAATADQTATISFTSHFVNISIQALQT